MKIRGVRCAEGAKQRMVLGVVATVAEVEPSHEADNPTSSCKGVGPGERRIHNHRLLVMCEEAPNLGRLEESQAAVGVPWAQETIHVAVFEVEPGLFIVGGHHTHLAQPER